MKHFYVYAIVLFLLTGSVYDASAQSTYTYKQPQSLDDGLLVQNLLSQKTDQTLINALFNRLAQIDHDVHSSLLIKDGALLIEEYFSGHSMDTQHDLRSVTKSVFSLLTGIAIDKGYIASVDDEVWTYLKTPVIKKNKDPRKQHITIEDLLTMRSGMDCNDWDKRSKGQEDKVYKKKDWLQYTADLPMIHKSGEKAFYCTMGVTLLAEAISQASGLSIDAFAEKYLFKPLGINDVSWGHTSKRKNIIASGKRLYMRPRDMAKIGLLVLNRGRWLKQSGQAEQAISEQIISEQWIDQSTATHTRLGGQEYGYLWWQFTLKSKDKSTRVISANGNGGQYIFVFPEWDMVAVFTGGAYNSKSGKLPYAILRDIYFPTFVGQ